jgi:hypothetical protein
MADDISASVIPLHQAPPRKRAKTGAERARAYRQRKKASAVAPAPSEYLIPLDFVTKSFPVSAPVPTVTLHAVTAERPLAPVLLQIAALALACVGLTMNGWFARSLGSTDAAG